MGSLFFDPPCGYYDPRQSNWTTQKLVHDFSIGDNSKKQIRLRATLTFDHSGTLILSLCLNGEQPNSAVVLLHQIRVFSRSEQFHYQKAADSDYYSPREYFELEPDSGPVELSQNEFKVNTGLTRNIISQGGVGTLTIKLKLSNKILTTPSLSATAMNERYDAPGFDKSFQQFGFHVRSSPGLNNVQPLTVAALNNNQQLRHTALNSVRPLTVAARNNSQQLRPPALNNFLQSNTQTLENLQQFSLQTLDDFEFMLNDYSTADVKVKVTLGKEKTFNCHKFILLARSTVFREMFSSQMKEAPQNVVVINDVSAQTMEHFLSFLYCGRFQDESWTKFLPNLTYLAHKYDVTALKQLCNLHLIKCVTTQNAVAIANLAERYELTTALAEITSFIRSSEGINFDYVKASEGLEIGKYKF